jgi:hypothetical protein
MNAIQAEIDKRQPIIDYFNNTSIDNSEGDQLSTIGGIIGFPWPNAPTGIFGDNNFLFGEAADAPEFDNLTGFGGDGLTIGGLLSSATPEIGNRIPIDVYRLLLTQVAYLKSHGLTLKAIDQICSVFGAEYTIMFLDDTGNFILGFAADFPVLDAEHGLSGVTPPYDTMGGKLSGVGISNADIFVTFQTQIGSGYLWLIQQVFAKFTTTPQVFVSQGD